MGSKAGAAPACLEADASLFSPFTCLPKVTEWLQHVKALTDMLDDLSSISGTHMVEEKTQVLRIVL